MQEHYKDRVSSAMVIDDENETEIEIQRVKERNTHSPATAAEELNTRLAYEPRSYSISSAVRQSAVAGECNLDTPRARAFHQLYSTLAVQTRSDMCGGKLSAFEKIIKSAFKVDHL